MSDKGTSSLATPPRPTPSRRSALGYGEPPTTRRSLGQRVITSLKTLAWVTPLTILIWAYAEREQNFTDPNPVPCPVELQASSPDRSVILVLPDQTNGAHRDTTVTVTLSGPRANVYAAEREIRTMNAGHPAIQIALGPEYAPGEHTLDTKKLIDSNRVFASYGVTVKSCEPAALTVKIDTMTENSLPVRAAPTPDNLDGDPIFDPPTVNVRAPTSYFNQPNATSLSADLTKFVELKQDGQHTLPSVAVTWPYKDESVSFATASVKAIVRTSTPAQNGKVDSMLVYVIMPPGLEQHYKVEYDPSLINVRVKGPQKDIETINKLDPPPRAMLEVKPTDLKNGADNTRGVTFSNLPPEVKVLDPASYKVTFKLVERNGDSQ